MKKLAHDWILAVLASISVLWIFVFVWSYLFHAYMPAVKSETYNVTMPSHVYAGETFSLCRKMEFTRNVDIGISRWMTTVKGGTEINISLPHSEVTRNKGKVTQCRPVTVPEYAPPGIYTIHTTANYITWPFWSSSVVMPDLEITVME